MTEAAGVVPPTLKYDAVDKEMSHSNDANNISAALFIVQHSNCAALYLYS